MKVIFHGAEYQTPDVETEIVFTNPGYAATIAKRYDCTEATITNGTIYGIAHDLMQYLRTNTPVGAVIDINIATLTKNDTDSLDAIIPGLFRNPR